uniref:Uncharacterized protein n=1 Tax=Anopheles atroparvus TaxID=41427 RepID=A0AAG5CSB1_ANOAO
LINPGEEGSRHTHRWTVSEKDALSISGRKVGHAYIVSVGQALREKRYCGFTVVTSEPHFRVCV